MVGPILSGWMLGHFWYGSVFLVNVPFIFVALDPRLLLRADTRVIPKKRARPRAAPVCRSSASRRSCTGSSRRPTDGWTGAAADRGVRDRGRVPRRVRALGAARRRADARHEVLPAPGVRTATGGMILVFLSMFGVMFLITQYFQLILGFSPSGLRVAVPADRSGDAHRRSDDTEDRGSHRRQPHSRARDEPRVDRVPLVHPSRGRHVVLLRARVHARPDLRHRVDDLAA